jgi:hypothetical protein
MAREPAPLGWDGQSQTDGFPVEYARFPRLAETNEGKLMWASIMEDGKVGIFIGRCPDPARPLSRYVYNAIFIERAEFERLLTFWNSWWEREKTEPLVEMYKHRYGQIAAELDGDSDGPDR